MKQKSLGFLAVTFTLLALAGSAVAAQPPLQVNVPFAFIVHNTTLPAGHYTVEVKSSDLLLIRGRRGLLLSKRGDEMKRLAGFWELPEASAVPGASLRQRIGRIRHSIVNQEFSVALWEATIRRKPSRLQWVEGAEVALLPLTTATRKALRLAGFQV